MKDFQFFLFGNSSLEILMYFQFHEKKSKQLKLGVITGNFQVYMTQVKYINFYCLKDGEWSVLEDLKVY